MTRIYAYGYMYSKTIGSTAYGHGTVEVVTDATKKDMRELPNDILDSVAKEESFIYRNKLILTFLTLLGEYNDIKEENNDI